MADFETSGVFNEEQLLSFYSKITKISYPIPDWHFYKAFYWWRGKTTNKQRKKELIKLGAIIAQGIGARLVAKQASSKEAQGGRERKKERKKERITTFEGFAAMTPLLAQLAKEEIDLHLEQGRKERMTVLVKGLREEDEYCHKVRLNKERKKGRSANEMVKVEEASNYNESVYVNFHSPSLQIGGEKEKKERKKEE